MAPHQFWALHLALKHLALRLPGTHPVAVQLADVASQAVHLAQIVGGGWGDTSVAK